MSSYKLFQSDITSFINLNYKRYMLKKPKSFYGTLKILNTYQVNINIGSQKLKSNNNNMFKNLRVITNQSLLSKDIT